VLGLALPLGGITTLVAGLLPSLLSPLTSATQQVAVLTASAVVLLAILGYACAALDGALQSPAVGDGYQILWPGRNAVLALRSGMLWLLCFVAGPILPATAAFLYWLHCGDPGLVDELILGELAIVTIAGWLLARASVSQDGRILAVSPMHVAELAHRLGWRALGVALLASGLAMAHGWLAIYSWEKFHRHAGLGWLLLTLCWVSGLFCGLFLFRLLGVWCRRQA
jgi:hypothetical protein